MCYVNFIWYLIVAHVCSGQEQVDDWTVHCRDNEQRPVDWWSIYKPPSRSFVERGRYFVYLTPSSEGKWLPSEQYITSSSMLMNTIKPLFMKNYNNYLAAVIYTDRSGDKGSAAKGILMADETGGVWISHTVPGLPDLRQEKPTFPDAEIENGHMITCMSLDHDALDNMLKVISQAGPAFTHINVPYQLTVKLPSWNRLNLPLQKLKWKSRVMDFVTREHKLNPIVVVRNPGDSHSLYEVFAKAKKVILDVYADPNLEEYFCTDAYGVRKIQGISLKNPDEVHYVNSTNERATFAVSTAAHWQRTGEGPIQFWACINSYEEQSMWSDKGTTMLCINDYEVWIAFANLKVKEPSC